MNYRQTIADPEGLIVLETPTEVQIKGDNTGVNPEVSVIPFTAIHDNDTSPGQNIEVWAGHTTFYLPSDAEYVVVTDLSLENLTDGISNVATAGRASGRVAES